MSDEQNRVTGEPQEGVPSQSERSRIRAEFFKSRNFAKEMVTIKGVKMEVRQPSIGDILDFRAEEDRNVALMRMMITYCYIPGTNETIFEDTDFDGIMALPFDESVIALSNAIEKLTGLDLKETEKN